MDEMEAERKAALAAAYVPPDPESQIKDDRTAEEKAAVKNSCRQAFIDAGFPEVFEKYHGLTRSWSGYNYGYTVLEAIVAPTAKDSEFGLAINCTYRCTAADSEPNMISYGMPGKRYGGQNVLEVICAEDGDGHKWKVRVSTNKEMSHPDNPDIRTDLVHSFNSPAAAKQYLAGFIASDQLAPEMKTVLDDKFPRSALNYAHYEIKPFQRLLG